MSSTAVFPPAHFDPSVKGAQPNFLDDAFWKDNPNSNLLTADPAQIEECWRQLARQDTKWQHRLAFEVNWNVMSYRSTLLNEVQGKLEIVPLPKPGSTKSLRRRLKVMRDKLGWMLHLRRVKQGEADPAPVHLTEEEHANLMNYGVLPERVDERKLSCEELAKVRAIRSGAAVRRTATEVRRSYRRLGTDAA